MASDAEVLSAVGFESESAATDMDGGHGQTVAVVGGRTDGSTFTVTQSSLTVVDVMVEVVVRGSRSRL